MHERKTASVDLPVNADGVARVSDDKSGVAIGFRMRGARPSRLTTTSEGLALYPAAGPEGGDIVHRVHAEGTEDFVAFEAKPEREALEYEVDVSQVPGLRLVSNVLEFLEANGTPALRIKPPYVVGRDGVAHAAQIRVAGCAYDENTDGPWGRAVTAPGAEECEVSVEWTRVTYPLLVDPSWVATGSMTIERMYHTATLLDSGKVLVAGGDGVSGSLSSAELFDGTSTFAATGSMSIVRYMHTATLLGSGKVLIAGGNDNFDAVSSCELFDGTSAFTATGSLTIARGSHTATRLPSGKVLIAGGAGSGTNLSTAELFDGTSSFSSTGPMTLPRYYHTATLLNSGKVLIVGGSGAGADSTAELFDGTSSFTATGALLNARYNHSATLLKSGKVLIAGGYAGGTFPSTAELFDGTSAFAATGAMTAPRSSHTATLLNSGSVLLAGGNFNAPVRSNSELFDGTTGFSTAGLMTANRSGHTATLLASGNVLVAGGPNSFGGGSSAELFTLAPSGGNCASPVDCAAGLCLQGICCAAPCPNGGICQACAPGTGACVTVTNADQTDNCTGANTCSAAGVCLLKNGQPSNGGAGCASGFASDGVCCDTDCSAGCDVCAAALGAGADGTCSLAPVGRVSQPLCANRVLCNGAQATCASSCASDNDCSGTDYCGVDAACHVQKTRGQACTVNGALDCLGASCRVCTTGHCVDGVCCDQACGAQCQACDVPGSPGVCSPTTGSPHGSRPACNGTDSGASATCSGACDGVNMSACTYPGATTSCSSVCSGSSVTVGLCSGQGACVAGAPTPCSGNLTCADSATCRTACATDTDCVAGYGCTASLCGPKGARCLDSETSENPAAGTGPISCSPYKCDEASGGCLRQCTSAAGCVSPHVCNASGDCVVSGSQKSQDSGGCAMARARHSASPRWWPLVLGICWGRRRRQQSRARSCILGK